MQAIQIFRDFENIETLDPNCFFFIFGRLFFCTGKEGSNTENYYYSVLNDQTLHGTIIGCVLRISNDFLSDSLPEKCPNTELVNLRIQSKYGKIRTRKTPYLDTYAVI